MDPRLDGDLRGIENFDCVNASHRQENSISVRMGGQRELTVYGQDEHEGWMNKGHHRLLGQRPPFLGRTLLLDARHCRVGLRRINLPSFGVRVGSTVS